MKWMTDCCFTSLVVYPWLTKYVKGYHITWFCTPVYIVYQWFKVFVLIICPFVCSSMLHLYFASSNRSTGWGVNVSPYPVLLQFVHKLFVSVHACLSVCFILQLKCSPSLEQCNLIRHTWFTHCVHSSVAYQESCPPPPPCHPLVFTITY